MAATQRCVLDIRHLRTYLNTSRGAVKAVDDVSFEVHEGETVGLIGESGCGKTMTALSILRLVPHPPAEILGGEILLRGRNLLELPEGEMRRVRGKQISMILQNPMNALNPSMRAGDQIAEGIRVHQGVDKRGAIDRAVEILERLNIPSPAEVADQYPHQLSGGMRQRVLLAIAISSSPSLIIADEPTSALDVTTQLQITVLLKEIIREFDSSLLLITHDMGIVAEICDRVYVMYAGKIVEHADVYALFQHPAHPYTSGLLKAVLSIDEPRKTLATIEGMVPSLIDPPTGCRFHPRCPLAEEVCRDSEPATTEVERGHWVSCWLYE